MYFINKMYLMKDNMLIRIKCNNCEQIFFKKMNSSNFFCTKDCKSSFHLTYNNLKKNRNPLKN